MYKRGMRMSEETYMITKKELIELGEFIISDHDRFTLEEIIEDWLKYQNNKGE